MPGSDLSCFLNPSETHFSHFLSSTINFAAAPSMLSGVSSAALDLLSTLIFFTAAFTSAYLLICCAAIC